MLMKILPKSSLLIFTLLLCDYSYAQGKLSETYENGGGKGKLVRMFSCDFGDVMGMGHHIEMLSFAQENKVLFGEPKNPQWIKYHYDGDSYSWDGCYYLPITKEQCKPDSYEFVMDDQRKNYFLYVRRHDSTRIDKHPCEDMSYRS
jgi:hypothetical protein